MSTRLEQLEKLHALDPADPFVTYGIALEHAKVHKRQPALDWLNKTLAIDPNYFYAYYQLAKLHTELGDDATARKVLTDAITKARAVQDPDAQHAAQEMNDLLQTLD
ncbi:MAG: tetratricopeptide repeat protein [Phycisphaera sp.]|nr:tetratricopeptide repeat protein [Phycisphaera sp.]